MAFKRMNKKNFISTIVTVVLLLAFTILIKGSIRLPNLINYILIYSIAALSLNVICGCLGEFVLGHGGFILVGYTVAGLIAKFMHGLYEVNEYKQIIYTHAGCQLHPLGYVFIIIDVLIAALATGVIGFIVGSIALGRLKGDYLAIVTLGVSLIFVEVCKNIPALSGLNGVGAASFLGGTTILYAVFFVLTVALILAFMKSRFGRSILSCRDDVIAAEACGVDVKKYKIMAFTFASFIAGLAGGLLCHHTKLIPTDFGLDFSILFLIIIVLGGLGSLTGTVVATVVIVLYEQWFCMESWVPEFFKNNPKIIYGVILVAIMLFRSQGILGTSEFSWKWFYNKIKEIWFKIFKNKTPKEVK